MQDIVKLHQDVILKKVSIDSLEKYKDNTFRPLYNMIIAGKVMDKRLLTSFIKLCIDYYTYSESGDTLITDTEYDNVVRYYLSLGNPKIIYPDAIPDYTTWPFITHTAPGMVGSIEKIYTEEELQKYLDKNIGIDELIIAPKYDGGSVCIEKKNNKIEYAVTRADGSKGQNILPVVRGAWNSYIFTEDTNFSFGDYEKVYYNMPDGYYKCELCMNKSDFENLIQEKKYANRRSATTGIVNSPKNLPYTKFITIIPLAYYDGKDNFQYIAPGQVVIPFTKKASKVLKEIDNMLSIIRHADYPFRTDGVIIYPKSKSLLINHNDIMEHAIAFKVNTAEAFTTIEYGYMSVGRLGNAVPMVKVKPVEVNETIVNDVSLCSYDKYAGMDLHEGETVIVYSAGDVIPQIRIPEQRQYEMSAPYLKISKKCPYCDEKLERIGSEYKCTNEKCPRIKSGKITNFLVKLGVKEISDKTVEDLYNAKLIKHIDDVFELDSAGIEQIPGYSTISANNIINEINALCVKEITISELFGALGILNISEKKCRNIFRCISLKKVLDYSKNEIIDEILCADGVAMKTAQDFADFIVENRALIRHLVKILNIRPDREYKGNVVFTGFRDEELVKEFEKINYEVAESVNSKTLAVVNSENDENSTKCKAARKKGITIVSLSDVDMLLKALSRR